MNVITKDLGAATAYAYAVEKGYTGTEEEFAELMASYADVGQTAVDAKDAAVAAKTAAQTAATTATNKATEATTAATTATTKAGEASTSASTATSAKDTAVSASQTATTKATEATTAAATATSAATTATTAKDDAVSAKTAAQTAQTGAETAAASVEASAAQIETNAEDISQLKSELTDIESGTKNLFKYSFLESVDSWSREENEYHGRIGKLYAAYHSSTFPITFKANTRYTLSFKGKNTGETTEGSGIRFYFKYSDDSVSYSTYLPNATTEYTSFAYTSQANKSVVGLFVDYGSGSANVWYLKDLQIEEGVAQSEYFPPVSAHDFVARSYVNNVGDFINDYLLISSIAVDFSTKEIGSTYQAIWIPYSIAIGETVKIEIICPNNDENTSYINFNDVNNSRLNPTALYTGTATRTVTFTNGYSAGVAFIGLTLIKVNVQNTYTINIYKPLNLPYRVSALELGLSGAEENIASLQGIVNKYAIPSYFETQVENAIAYVKSNIASTDINGETFVFISDIHWENNEKHSPALIKAITDALPVENVIFCGDAFNGGTQANMINLMNDARNSFAPVCKRFFSAFGNHDGNALDGGTAFTHKEFYTFMQKQSDYIMEYAKPYYYYFDNPTTKTRYIVLDTGTGTPASASEQLTWLQATLDSADDGYNVIVFAHVVYYPDTGGAYNDPSTYIMSQFMQDVCGLLDTENGLNRIKIQAIFGGHTHYDYNSQTTGGIPIVIIDCDTRQTQSSAGHATGTVNEQCFDVVTVDYTAEKIYCVRVGRGSDRTITY